MRNPQITNFMKTCPVGALLCHRDGGLTDMMKLMIDFAFANSPNELKNKKLTLRVFVLYFTPSVFVTQAYSIPYLPKRKTIQLYSHRVRRKANELYCRRRNVQKVKERNP